MPLRRGLQCRAVLAIEAAMNVPTKISMCVNRRALVSFTTKYSMVVDVLKSAKPIIDK